MEWDRENFLLFWAIFCLYTPLTTGNIKILKQRKSILRFHHFTHVYQKSQSFDVCFLRYGIGQTYFLSFWAIFCPFTPLFTLKLKLWNKFLKELDILFYYTCLPLCTLCTYGSWDMERHRQNFLSFWTIFCPFTPLTTWKTKILKKWKNVRRYYHFTHVYHKWKSYVVYFWRYERDRHNFFSFLTIFMPFYTSNNRVNQNLKKWKKCL